MRYVLEAVDKLRIKADGHLSAYRVEIADLQQQVTSLRSVESDLHQAQEAVQKKE